MLNKKEEEVKNKDVHGWKSQASVTTPHVANNPFPAENSRVPADMVSVEGDKKSDKILLAITAGVESKEEFRVKFSASDSSAYQYFTAVLALRNGETPVIKSNEILIDALREVSTVAQLIKVSGVSEKLGAEYFDFLTALRGE